MTAVSSPSPMAPKRDRSGLARLLATENLTVVQKRVSTAMFDTASRTLILPEFADGLSESVMDMFIGHEVGHALFTPTELSVQVMKRHESRYGSKFVRDHGNFLHMISNLVEDILIEKLIQNRYRGLRRDFVVAYRELNDQKFFGTPESFVARLNYRAKLGSLSGVIFTDAEQPVADQVIAVETREQFHDAVDVLVAYCVDQSEQTPNSSGSQSSDEDSTETDKRGDRSQKSESGDSESESESGSGSESGDSESESESGSGSESGDSESESGSGSESGDSDTEDREDGSSQESSGGSLGGALIADDLPPDLSDVVARANQDSESDGRRSYGERLATITGRVRDDYRWDRVIVSSPKIWSDYGDRNYNIKNADMQEEFARALDSASVVLDAMVKPAVDKLVSEFNQRKQAEIRATGKRSDTGELDPNRLHGYRFTEDIFSKSFRYNRGKNHGMVSFVDWSSSMDRRMYRVLIQVYTLIRFCDRLKIPYAFYGFADYIRFQQFAFESSYNPVDPNSMFHGTPRSGDFISAAALLELANSALSPKDRKNSMRMLTAMILTDRYAIQDAFYGGNRRGRTKVADLSSAASGIRKIFTARAQGLFLNKVGILGPLGSGSPLSTTGTPLTNSLCMAPQLINEFKASHNVDIVNFVLFSDGQSGYLTSGYAYREGSDFINPPIMGMPVSQIPSSSYGYGIPNIGYNFVGKNGMVPYVNPTSGGIGFSGMGGYDDHTDSNGATVYQDTATALNFVKSETGANVIGFFLTPTSHENGWTDKPCYGFDTHIEVSDSLMDPFDALKNSDADDAFGSGIQGIQKRFSAEAQDRKHRDKALTTLSDAFSRRF